MPTAGACLVPGLCQCFRPECNEHRTRRSTDPRLYHQWCRCEHQLRRVVTQLPAWCANQMRKAKGEAHRVCAVNVCVTTDKTAGSLEMPTGRNSAIQQLAKQASSWRAQRPTKEADGDQRGSREPYVAAQARPTKAYKPITMLQITETHPHKCTIKTDHGAYSKSIVEVLSTRFA